MAAIDLERGLEHGGHGWGKERPELMDNFDSEMQEWEEQLQDIQRKIEELYNEVQARRGANDISQKSGGAFECSRDQHAASHHSKSPPGIKAVPRHYSNGCGYSSSGCGHPVSHQSGYAYCHTNGEIGDLLQDYLGQGKQMIQKNNGGRHVRFSDTVKVNQDIPKSHNDIRRSSGKERLGQDQSNLHSFEENENRKNQMSYPTGYLVRESSPSKDNTGAKPPLGQRDVAPGQPRAHHLTESPALERKCYSPGILGDRKNGSPSVLRKFGAMLQENEGKMLNELGVVTHQGLVPEPKCPTLGCQRRASGAATAAGRAPSRAPAQKCQVDSNRLVPDAALGQDRGSVSDTGRHNQREHRGSYCSPKASRQSPGQSQRRSQVAGSPKVRHRVNSGAEKDRGDRARRSSLEHLDPRTESRLFGSSPGAQKVHGGALAGHDCSHVRDDGLIELLDMLDIQHEYTPSSRAGHTAYREEPQQAHPAELSAAQQNRNFSRPARPANQRPPSRWAGRTPTARITSPSGPKYLPPSPLSRPASPMTRSPSPARKHRPFFSYSLQTETVIM